MIMENEIDTFNKFGVGGIAGGNNDVAILAFQRRLSHDDALLLAAWIVALADPSHEQFNRVLKAVENT